MARGSNVRPTSGIDHLVFLKPGIKNNKELLKALKKELLLLCQPN